MKIITDSTADLSWEIYERFDIGVVPLTIQLGDKTWRDFYDVKPDEYYELLRKTRSFPTTSQPSPQEFVDAFTPSVEAGTPIMSVHLSSKLSGTYQSAVLAKSQFPDARIEVIDSRQASLGLAMIVFLCAQNAASGVAFDDVIAQAHRLVETEETYFSVDSLDYLQRGGRIGKAQAFLGTLMKVKPLLRLEKGEILPTEKIRTTERLLGRFVEIVEKAVQEQGPVALTTGESDNSNVMTDLIGRLLAIPGVTLAHRCKLGGVIISHAGPGALAISVVKA